MPEPRPVNDADVLAAWSVLYARASEFSHIETLPPDPRSSFDTIIVDALRRVLVADRQRVLEAVDD